MPARQRKLHRTQQTPRRSGFEFRRHLLVLSWLEGQFGEAEFTKRQAVYEPALGEQGPFTPQMVIDGKAGNVGFRLSEVESLISAAHLFAKVLYKARARIEQGIGVVKRFKQVALRCEKTARNYKSIVSLAAGLCLIKFVRTA